MKTGFGLDNRHFFIDLTPYSPIEASKGKARWKAASSMAEGIAKINFLEQLRIGQINMTQGLAFDYTFPAFKLGSSAKPPFQSSKTATLLSYRTF